MRSPASPGRQPSLWVPPRRPRLTPKENTHQTKAGSEVSDSLFLVKLFMLGSLHSRWVVRSHRHHRARPLSFNATLEAMRHHHSTVTLLTFRSPPPTTVRRRHRPVRFRRRPIDASVTVFIERKRTGRSPHAEKFMGANFTAHHESCVRRFSAPQVALTRPRLSRFALHYGRPSILEKNPTAAWTQD